MPATAGRIRMPANNRMSVSDSLKSSEIWQKTVGYDPYAPLQVDAGATTRNRDASARKLYELTKMSGNTSTRVPGACPNCNQVGHLAYQCRNDPNRVWESDVAVKEKKRKSTACPHRRHKHHKEGCKYRDLSTKRERRTQDPFKQR